MLIDASEIVHVHLLLILEAKRAIVQFETIHRERIKLVSPALNCDGIRSLLSRIWRTKIDPRDEIATVACGEFCQIKSAKEEVSGIGGLRRIKLDGLVRLGKTDDAINILVTVSADGLNVEVVDIGASTKTRADLVSGHFTGKLGATIALSHSFGANRGKTTLNS